MITWIKSEENVELVNSSFSIELIYGDHGKIVEDTTLLILLQGRQGFIRRYAIQNNQPIVTMEDIPPGTYQLDFFSEIFVFSSYRVDVGLKKAGLVTLRASFDVQDVVKVSGRWNIVAKGRSDIIPDAPNPLSTFVWSILSKPMLWIPLSMFLLMKIIPVDQLQDELNNSTNSAANNSSNNSSNHSKKENFVSPSIVLQQILKKK